VKKTYSVFNGENFFANYLRFYRVIAKFPVPFLRHGKYSQRTGCITSWLYRDSADNTLWESNRKILSVRHICSEINCFTVGLQGGPKIGTFLYAFNFIKYWLIFYFFHSENQKNIYNNTITKDPTVPKVRLIISSTIDQFSNFFHCKNQENICNNIITKCPITL